MLSIFNKVPGAFSFSCDRGGDFVLTFNIRLSSHRGRIPITSNSCSATIRCLTSSQIPQQTATTTTLAIATSTTTTVCGHFTNALILYWIFYSFLNIEYFHFQKPPLTPKIKCIPFVTLIRIGRPVSIPILNSVYRVEYTEGDPTMSQLETKIKHIQPSNEIGVVESSEVFGFEPILIYFCQREGRIQLDIAITVLERTSSLMDLEICSIIISRCLDYYHFIADIIPGGCPWRIATKMKYVSNCYSRFGLCTNSTSTDSELFDLQTVSTQQPQPSRQQSQL